MEHTTLPTTAATKKKFPHHATYHPDVVGHLDKVEYISGIGTDGMGRVHLVGWAFVDDMTKPGAISFQSHPQGFNWGMRAVRRDDVARAYQRPEMAMCGFDAFLDCPLPSADDNNNVFHNTHHRPNHNYYYNTPGTLRYSPSVLGRLSIQGEKSKIEFMDVTRPSEEVPLWSQKKKFDAAATTTTTMMVTTSSSSSSSSSSSAADVLAISLQRDPLPTVVVIDDVYTAPLLVREFALRQTFVPHELFHKGQRTDLVFPTEAMKELIERRLGARIDAKSWAAGPNGCFQWCKAGDQLVYHVDSQQWAGVLFLTPDAPVQCGTSLFRSRATLKRRCDDADTTRAVFGDRYLDATMFEKVDEIGNVFNRLVIFNARHIHAASAYFGSDVRDSRLFQMFFFNAATTEDDDDNV